MKKIKYFGILMLVGLLTLTGCSVGKKLSPEERLEKALNNLKSAESLTLKGKFDVRSDDESAKMNINVKVAKGKKGYDLYLGLDAESDDEEYSLEGYLLTSKRKIDLYFMMEDYVEDWAHLKLDLDDLEDMGLDTDDIKLDDLEDYEIDMDVFKKVKEGATEDGITEIIATIDADELDGIGDYQLDKDLKVSFFIDRKNNLTKIEINLADYIDSDEIDKAKFSVEISNVNDTKVKVPSDVEEDAEEIDLEELITELLNVYGGQGTITLPTTTDDDDYDAEDIFDDIIISAKIETCSNGDFEVDFKKYNDELFLYDDEYDIKRIKDGVIKFTKNGDKCNFEITTPIVIDDKTCTRVDEYNSECK